MADSVFIAPGGPALSNTELGYLDGVTAGTGAANKAMVFGASSIVVTGEINATTLSADRMSVYPSGTTQSIAGGLSEIVNHVTSIADNVATTLFTVTIPNAAHAASIKVRVLSINGGTDAEESARTAESTFVLTRTAGADTVFAQVAISDEAIATVAAGATHTLAIGSTAISGASSATQTFTITVTINDSGSAGSNVAIAHALVLNHNSSGVTVT